MRAAQMKRFGDVNEHLTVEDGVAAPTLLPHHRNHVVIKVYACSLSPSDYRMSSGDASLVKKPATDGWPYIPGGDISGVVEGVSEGVTSFKLGDRVVGTWDAFGMGGLGEYSVVDCRYVEKLPAGFSFVQGAAMVDSASNGMLAAEDVGIEKGERVLVVGGSGAVGNVVVQLAKRRGAFVVATSTQTEMVRGLGADVVVDYRGGEWWRRAEVTGQGKFDVVVDCAEGVRMWERACEEGLVKCGREGGRFLAVVVNEWDIVIQTAWDMIRWFAPVVGRMVGSRVWRGSVARYDMMFPAPRGDSLKRCLGMVERGEIKVVVDERGPFPFTTAGVRRAFDLMIARAAHGKVVVQLRDEE
eukprot:GFKZ01015210.1.p1 GENE.GFKZ01015210.1~~GFKZ01015210.1.p1  ORF type:complete len:356 (+),score=48.61 GFKZ01015210.1:236-1303(+)